MPAGEVRVADIGTVFRATVQDGGTEVDVSAATLRRLIFRKPNGTLLTKTATLTTDGTDGQIEYATVTGDLDTPGRWMVQGYVEIGSGRWHTDISQFTVHKNLN